MSPKEKIEILEAFYGCYIVKEFLLTKFYPALDTNGDVILQNSEIMQRLEDGYWVKEVEIETAEYRGDRILPQFYLLDDGRILHLNLLCKG